MPEILAAIIIANHPTQYGFEDITLDPPVITDTVTINYSVDLRLVADLVDAPIDELIALNPSLLRFTTPPDGPFDLHLPAGTATLFEQRVAGIPETKRGEWRYHRVADDDTLASVARAFRVSVSELAAANQMEENDPLTGVEALVVPVAPVAAPSSTECSTPPAGAIRWFPSPIASVFRSANCGGGTALPASGLRPVAGSTWPSLLMSS